MNITQYLKEVQAELKEVVFPSRRQTVIYTVLVIVISVIVALSLFGVDLGLRELLAKILVK